MTTPGVPRAGTRRKARRAEEAEIVAAKLEESRGIPRGASKEKEEDGPRMTRGLEVKLNTGTLC
jgi:hypothetical protein